MPQTPGETPSSVVKPPPLPPNFAAGPIPLAYARPMDPRRRAGPLTAIATISLILGVFGLIDSGVSCGEWSYFWWNSIPPPPPPSLPPLPMPVLTPHDGDFVAPAGLKFPVRRSLIVALRSLPTLSERMTPESQLMLNRLLAEAGRDIIGGEGRDPAAAIVTTGSEGPHNKQLFFVTVSGKVLFDDGSARFVPKTASSVIKVEGNTVQVGEEPAQWSAITINEALETIRDRASGDFNALQAAAIIPHIRSLAPAESRDARSNLIAVPQIPIYIPHPPGTQVVLFGMNDSQWIYPNGRIHDYYASDSPWGTDMASGRPIFHSDFQPAAPGSTTAMLAQAIPEAIAFLLAAWLIISAIQMFRERPSAAAMQLWWAIGKTFLIPPAAVAAIWYLDTMGRPPYGWEAWWLRTVRSGGIASIVFGAILGLAYPVAVTIVMKYSAWVRADLATRNSGPWFFPPAIRKRWSDGAGRLMRRLESALGVALRRPARPGRRGGAGFHCRPGAGVEHPARAEAESRNRGDSALGILILLVRRDDFER